MSTVALLAQTNFRKELKRFASRRSRNKDDVEDLVQDAIVRLLTVDDKKVIQKPLAFMYGTLRHVMAEARGNVSRWEDIIFPMNDEDQEHGEDLTDRLIDDIDAKRRAHRIMRRLLPSHARVMWLHKGLGMSYKEVAEHLGLSIHTVEKYVTLAKSRIREMER